MDRYLDRLVTGCKNPLSEIINKVSSIIFVALPLFIRDEPVIGSGYNIAAVILTLQLYFIYPYNWINNEAIIT